MNYVSENMEKHAAGGRINQHNLYKDNWAINYQVWNAKPLTQQFLKYEFIL